MSRAPRVGFFGLLGSGNLGNDGSFEAVLNFLRSEHPDARIDAFCAGPDVVRARYGIAATRLNWYRAEYQTASGVRSIVLKAFGKVVDAFRTAAWVRRQDVVIVPGMGVLEATLPLRPWGLPYSLLLLTLSGRVLGTKVALVSVGAAVIERRATRTLTTWAARLATYRSYRDELSRDAMRRMGVDTSDDEVYPDLAFALPVPEAPSSRAVGVGVMAYHGGNDDRARADEIHARYVGELKRFVKQLVADGRQVRLFVGDDADQVVVDRLVADGVTAARTSTLEQLMREMAAVDTVVATRYHNVLCALKLGKPTISLGYAAKNDVLMASMGLGEFCQQARSVDVDRLLAQFRELDGRRPELVATLAERNRLQSERLRKQFDRLSREIR